MARISFQISLKTFDQSNLKKFFSFLVTIVNTVMLIEFCSSFFHLFFFLFLCLFFHKGKNYCVNKKLRIYFRCSQRICPGTLSTNLDLHDAKEGPRPHSCKDFNPNSIAQPFDLQMEVRALVEKLALDQRNSTGMIQPK